MKHHLKLPLIILLCLCAIIKESHAQTKTSIVLNGFVKDANTGEALIGATVFVNGTTIGTTTNGYGFFTLIVPKGKQKITFSYIGYNNTDKDINVNTDQRITVELSPISTEIEAVTITRDKGNSNVSKPQMSVAKLSMKTVKQMPALMGEVDVIKAIQLLPGIQSAAEGSSGFNVRGGNFDQNLILLDEATVYNASHLMGFFSVFNNDAINDITVYKGDMPASLGGRLSSVLDIKMKEGNSKKFTATGGIGSISSRLTLEGPIKKDSSSFIISGRRTYIDMFFPLFNNEDLNSSKLYFYDLNAKVNLTLNQNNRVYASGYFGRDVFGESSSQFGFGNNTLSLRWNHIFSNNLYMNNTIIGSQYNYYLQSLSNDANAFKWDSKMKEFAIKSNFTLNINEYNTLKFGFSSSFLSFNPGVVTAGSEQSFFNKFEIPQNYALEHGLYISNDQTIGKFKLKYGLRLSIFQNIGKGTLLQMDSAYNVIGKREYASGKIFNTYINPEPRLGVTYLIDAENSLKASYTHAVQYVQLASNSQTGNPLDVWFPASPNVKPQKADQWAMGYFRNFKNNTIETSLEVYYKNLTNLIDFKDFASILLNDEMEAEIRTGKGYAYGAELYFRFNFNKLDGWLSYTYNRTYRTINGVNNNKTYRASYDKPHNISFVVNYNLTKRTNFSAIWILSSGQAFTPPVGNYKIDGATIPIYSDRNGSRFPTYHRLDLSLNIKSKKNLSRRWQGEWNISVYNAYNRKNAWSIIFEKDEDNPNIMRAEKIYILPIIPSVTYNFKF